MSLQIATFQSDATPPLGAALCHGNCPPARRIVDSLSARGIVLFGNAAPIVLCVVDWVAIAGASHDAWRAALATAAGTTCERVAVHTVHQHDAPGTDHAVDELLAPLGLGNAMFDDAFEQKAIRAAAAALEAACHTPKPVTHIALGKARVSRFASNRRLLGPDGTVQHVRYSSCRDAAIRALDEGLIDPFVRQVGFWRGEQPLATLTYYATHPQSFYGHGAVSADTVGLARDLREATVPECAHLHFNGAGGNVAAGKYNDGSPPNRLSLANRLADGMAAAWENAVRIPVTADHLGWRVQPVALPLHKRLRHAEAELQTRLGDTAATLRRRISAARELAYARRVEGGHHVDIACLELGPVRILHLPGELFVEYQLKAQKERPDLFVCLAAYGDDGMCYIGTHDAYAQGGYECSRTCARVSPDVEVVLNDAMHTLLHNA